MSIFKLFITGMGLSFQQAPPGRPPLGRQLPVFPPGRRPVLLPDARRTCPIRSRRRADPAEAGYPLADRFHLPLHEHRPGCSWAWLLLAVVLYLLLTVFLNGGIIGCLNRPEASTTLADFFHDCGLYFWRFLRLFLLSIPVYLLAVGDLLPLLRTLLNVFDRRATTEWPALIASNLRFLALVLLLTVVSMFFDYVKIGLVTSGRKKVLQETWRTV